MSRVAWTLALLLSTVSACDSCRCAGEAVEREFEKPDDETLIRLVREKLGSAKDIAAKACGLSEAGGLQIDELKVQKEMLDVPGSSYVDIKGKPIAPKPKPEKALVCIAVLFVGYKAVRNAQGKATGWKLDTFELYEVKTPGAEWRKPSGDDD